MLLLFLSLFRHTISELHHICVCHASECEYACQKINIEGNFKIVLPNEFENYIIRQFYSSHYLIRQFNVYVTFNDIPIRFNLSSFNNCQISFYKYFDNTNISDISSKIRIKIINDINTSSVQLAFSESNVVVSQPIFSKFEKPILSLGSLTIRDGSSLYFENGEKSAILNAKCCSLNDISLMVFDEIYVENGYCSEDFSLSSSSIRTLYFNQYNYSKINYFLMINNKVKIYNALKLKIESNDNNNLIVLAKSQNSSNDHLKINPQIFLYSFDQIYFENNAIIESINFSIKNTRSIICKAKYLSADFDNLDLFIESDTFINGVVDNISVNLNRNLESNRIKLAIAQFQNYLNIKSSFIDINILHLDVFAPNPIIFCVGKGGISQVTVNSFKIKSDLTVESAFQDLYLNRDFQAYLSDLDIEPFLYKYTKYLEIPYSKSYIQKNQYEIDIRIKYTDSVNIHGFSNFDSVLTAIEMSSNPKVYAVYFDSPDKKSLNICLTSDTSVNLNNCFLMNNFTNDILQLNSGINNVLIYINSSYEYDYLNFESFFVKNLTITAKYDSKVHFGTLNFIGKVASNLTITNLHNLTFKITPTYEMDKICNIDNICIFNSSVADLGLNGTEKIRIENLSICQFLNFPSNWEVRNLNCLSNCIDLSYIIASYNKELLYVSSFGFINLSNYENFNIYFPFYTTKNQDSSVNEKNLYIFLNTDRIPNFNIYMMDDNASILFYKWEDIPSIFNDYYNDIQNEVSVVSSSNSIDNGENRPFLVYHFDFNLNLCYSMQLSNINHIGSGFVSNSLFYEKTQKFNVDSVSTSQNLDSELNKISFEEVFLTFNTGEIYRPNKVEVNISSMRNKIVHFTNSQPVIQKVHLFEKADSVANDQNTPSYHILLNSIQLYLKKLGSVAAERDNDENNCHFNQIYFDEVSLFDGALLKGFSAEETTFRRLECTFNDLYSFSSNIKITEKLSLYGKIEQDNKIPVKTIQFSPNSLLEMNFSEPELKISIGERMIKIGSFTFVGVEHAEIIIDKQPNLQSEGFKYIIEHVQKEGLNFSLFPKVSITQSGNNKDSESKMLANNEEEEEETYKFINIKSQNNKKIRKGINEKVAKKFQILSKKFDFYEDSEKVRVINSKRPSELKNSIHLLGNWTGCDSRFSFQNLSSVDFFSESETVPFHFISTLGDIIIHVKNDKTNFLGNFLCSNTEDPLQITVLCENIGKTISNVTFCGTFGGSSEVHFRLCQPRLHACFNKVFFQQNSLNIHLFISVDGYSMFSILEGGSFVDQIIHLNFECTLELTDPKITEFLDEKEKAIGLYVDSSFSNRVIIGWDKIPETPGLFESFEFHFSRRTRRLLYVMRQSPFDVPLSICVGYDMCEVNIPSEDNFNDIRSFLPKGKKSILMLLTESSDSVLNFNYPFFDNYTVFLIGYGIIDMTLSFGYNHVSELDLSSVSAYIHDKDNYSINYVLATSGSKIKNINGIQKLEFTDFYDFKSNQIDSFMNRIIIPSVYDQIVFQKNGILLKNIESSYQFNNSNFPDLEIKVIDPEIIFSNPDSTINLQFLLDDDNEINDNNINNISILFDKKTIINIGKGWDKIDKSTIFNRVEGLSNIDQIITESFPFHPFSVLTNQEVNNKPVPVYPSNNLFPISITTEFSLLENETIILDLSQLSFDNAEPNISFGDALIMNDRTKIQILDNDSGKQRIINNNDQESNNCYIGIDQLIISKDSSCSISSARVNERIEMEKNSDFFGDLIFDKKSVLVINGEYNSNTKKLVNFPSIVFESYPKTIPSKIIVNISKVTNNEHFLNGKMVSDFNIENKKYRETKEKMQILNSLETTPGVFLSNLGFLCSSWVDVVDISSSITTLKPSCVNGYLKITNEIDDGDEIIIISPTQTPFEINLSDYAHPTMTPISNIRNNRLDGSFVQSFLGVIIVGSIFSVIIVVLLVIVINLKKKYSKLGTIQDEDDNNIHVADDVIKL